MSFKGGFSTTHTFVVVKELPVQCFLGSDFLMKHAAIINYAEQCLLVGKGNQFKTPLCESRSACPQM